MAYRVVKQSTRSWLDAALKQRKFDAIDEMMKLFRSTDEDLVKVRILENLWDRLYPKARPEDADGKTEDGAVVNNIAVTDEQLTKLLKTARGEG